jgi:hypothetical protein
MYSNLRPFLPKLLITSSPPRQVGVVNTDMTGVLTIFVPLSTTESRRQVHQTCAKDKITHLTDAIVRGVTYSMKQRTDIHADGVSFKETTKPVMLVVKNDSIPACDHIEIKVTQEGVIIERWDETNCRFVHAYGLTFDEDFQDKDERSFQTELINPVVGRVTL